MPMMKVLNKRRSRSIVHSYIDLNYTPLVQSRNLTILHWLMNLVYLIALLSILASLILHLQIVVTTRNIFLLF